MPEKKKTTVAKSPDARVTKARPPTPARTAESARAAGPSSTAPGGPQPASAQKQFSTFEQAMKVFHARSLKEARDLFRLAAEGPERDVADRARLHVSMCDRRLEQATVSLGSAEDCYNYGIALLNTRNAAEARVHLEKGLTMAPGADHILYALALAQAMSGELLAASENLRRAIELEPRNRIMARQETDFAHLANQPPFDSLLYPEKKGW
jgi:tetratricopeptide (TPR) repeat protein